MLRQPGGAPHRAEAVRAGCRDTTTNVLLKHGHRFCSASCQRMDWNVRVRPSLLVEEPHLALCPKVKSKRRLRREQHALAERTSRRLAHVPNVDNTDLPLCQYRASCFRLQQAEHTVQFRHDTASIHTGEVE